MLGAMTACFIAAPFAYGCDFLKFSYAYVLYLWLFQCAPMVLIDSISLERTLDEPGKLAVMSIVEYSLLLFATTS